jgi:hypothetical protein
MNEWERTYPIEYVDNPDESFWRDIKSQHLVIPPDQGLKCKLMKYSTKDPSMDIPDKMKPSSVSTRNTSGLALGLGSQNTSGAVQPANRTKISHITSNPQYSVSHQ